MNSTPRISVIIPIYNAEKTLRRCIDSIVRQSFADYELLLVDDGSTDSSPEICDMYSGQDYRIKVYHQQNAGVSSARNAGIDHAEGEWIAFCDSDDYVDSDWLLDFIRVADGNDLIFQGMRYFRDGKSWDKIALEKSGSTLEEKQSHISRLIETGVFGYMMNKAFKKSIIDENSLQFDTNSRFREDEQFLSEYLIYVRSWQSVPSVNYNYFIPAENKCYGGDDDYSLTLIFRNLDKIFLNGYTSGIANVHTENVKNMIINKVCRNEIPSEADVDLYCRLLSKSTRLQSRLLTHLIITSPVSSISRRVIRLIHRIKTEDINETNLIVRLSQLTDNMIITPP